MLQILKETKIDFVKFQKAAITFSIIIIIITLASVGYHAVTDKYLFNWSIEFVGGTQVQLKFAKPVASDIQKIRNVINEMGYTGSEIKMIGNEANNEILIIIRKQGETAVLGDAIRGVLSKALPDNSFELRRIEAVGPKIGGEMRRDATIAVFLALLAILVYVWFRFQISFGVAAIIPLFHDVLMTLGLFSVLDREFSLSFLAALLTIIGFSLNDTVVIFDRIRENMKGGLKKGTTFKDLVNLSINQTLSRTIITAGVAFAVLAILFVIGSETIKDFALAMMWGVAWGTYSTVFIASPVLLWWHKRWPIVK